MASLCLYPTVRAVFTGTKSEITAFRDALHAAGIVVWHDVARQDGIGVRTLDVVVNLSAAVDIRRIARKLGLGVGDIVGASR